MSHPDDRISIDVRVMGGVLCIAGTRIPVETVVGLVEQGESIANILSDFPQLNGEDVQAALAFHGKIRGTERDEV